VVAVVNQIPNWKTQQHLLAFLPVTGGESTSSSNDDITSVFRRASEHRVLLVVVQSAQKNILVRKGKKIKERSTYLLKGLLMILFFRLY
jgi:hypothetical protein